MFIAEYGYGKDMKVKQKEAWQNSKQETEERMILSCVRKAFRQGRLWGLQKKR